MIAYTGSKSEHHVETQIHHEHMAETTTLVKICVMLCIKQGESESITHTKKCYFHSLSAGETEWITQASWAICVWNPLNNHSKS